MPLGGRRLSDGEIQAMYTWIRNGARETDEPIDLRPSPSPSPSGEPGDDDDGPGGDGPGIGEELGDVVIEPCDVVGTLGEPGYQSCSSSN